MSDFSKNYFELFELPVAYTLDLTELSERYRELQKRVHPDRYATATEQERRLSLQQATLVNEAHATLKSPLRRAQYMLSLLGIDMSEQETTKDVAFLMEQMELRERLESATQQADPYSVLDSIMNQVSGMKQDLIAQLTELLKSATPDDLAVARESVRKMQFLDKLYNEAELLEAELEEAI